VRRKISLFLATGCFLGFIPGAPGTYGSLAATVSFYLIYRFSHRVLPELHLSILGVIVIVGVVTSAEASLRLGSEDPPEVVIDEVAGQVLTFLFLPVSSWNLILGTALFRIFDIWKPYPIRRLESLKNGVGIMADDLLAGVYSNIVLRLVNAMIHG